MRPSREARIRMCVVAGAVLLLHAAALGGTDRDADTISVWMMGIESAVPEGQQPSFSPEHPGTDRVRILNLTPGNPFSEESKASSAEHGRMNPYVGSQRAIVEALDGMALAAGVNVDLAILSWDTAYRHIRDAARAGRPPDICEVGSTWVPTLRANGPTAEVPFRVDYRLLYTAIGPSVDNSRSGPVRAPWRAASWPELRSVIAGQGGMLWLPYDRHGANVLHDVFLLYWLGDGGWPESGVPVPGLVSNDGLSPSLPVLNALLDAPGLFLVEAMSEEKVNEVLLKRPGLGCFRPVSAANALYEYFLRSKEDGYFADRMDVNCPPATFKGGSSLLAWNPQPRSAAFLQALTTNAVVCHALAAEGDVPAQWREDLWADAIRSVWREREAGVVNPFHERLIAAVGDARTRGHSYPEVAEITAIETDSSVRENLLDLWYVLDSHTHGKLSTREEAGRATTAALATLQSGLRRHLRPGFGDWINAYSSLLLLAAVVLTSGLAVFCFLLIRHQRSLEQAEDLSKLTRQLVVRNVLGHQAPLHAVCAFLRDLPEFLEPTGTPDVWRLPSTNHPGGLKGELAAVAHATRDAMVTNMDLVNAAIRTDHELRDSAWLSLGTLVARSIETAAEMWYLRTLEIRMHPTSRFTTRLRRPLPSAGGAVGDTAVGCERVHLEGWTGDRRLYDWRCEVTGLSPSSPRVRTSQNAALLALALQEWFYNGFKALDKLLGNAGTEDGPRLTEVRAAVAFDAPSGRLVITTPVTLDAAQGERIFEADPQEPAATASSGRGLYVLNRILFTLGCRAADGLACVTVTDFQPTASTRLVLPVRKILEPGESPCP